MSKLEEFMESLPTAVSLDFASHTDEATLFVLSFSEKGFGFGEVCIKQTKEGVFVDTEGMGLDKVKSLLAQLMANAVTDEETDPERHKRYNQATNTTCGEHCDICRKDSQ